MFKILIDGAPGRLPPKGLTVLSGQPKSGKTTCLASLGLCVAEGKPYMGHDVTQSGVLYAAFNDTDATFQRRIERALDGRPVPPGFFTVAGAPMLGMGLLPMLDEHLKQHPETRLVVVDSVDIVRNDPYRWERSRDADRRDVGLLRDWAVDHGCSVILTLHTRHVGPDEAKSITDACDTVWTMMADKCIG